MRHLFVKEGDKIYLSEKKELDGHERGNSITKEELNEIWRIVEEKNLNKNFITMDPESIRFYNYVGYIKGKKFSIEILPKTHKESPGKARKILIDMLNYSEYLNIKSYSLGLHDKLESSLHEIFARILSDELMEKIFKGIYREYIGFEDDLNTVRGKIQINSHIKNIVRKRNMISCSFDEFTTDNPLNRVLKFGIKKIIRSVENSETLRKLRQILIELEDVSDISGETAIKTRIIFSRNNFMYESSYELIHLFINDCTTYGTGEDGGIGILFEMQILFEKYIGKAISEISKEKVNLQVTGKKVLENIKTKEKTMGIKPDIIIYDSFGRENIILDTKWKLLTDEKIT
ncbi:MAG: McrC family protein, partial [Fusobacteriaceae bacterium]